MPRIILFACLLSPCGLHAGQVEQGEVREDQGIYTLDLSVVLDTGTDAVFPLISDHAGLRRLSKVIVESTLLESPGPELARRRLLLHVCVLVFCFKGPLVEDVKTQGQDQITTQVVPALSSFKSGNSEWQLSALDQKHSRIRIHYALEPDFWIPPVIGPWLIKRKMRSVAHEAINQIETLARAR